MNKRGQEGISITTLLLLVLGIVVIVVLIIGVTGGFDFIFGKIKLLPGQSLQTVAESCNAASELKLKIDYCSEFKKIKVDGKTEYVNCQDSRVQAGMKDELKSKVECGGKDSEGTTSAQVQCDKLISDLSGKSGEKDCTNIDKVNGKICIKEVTNLKNINECATDKIPK